MIIMMTAAAAMTIMMLITWLPGTDSVARLDQPDSERCAGASTGWSSYL